MDKPSGAQVSGTAQEFEGGADLDIEMGDEDLFQEELGEILMMEASDVGE